MERWISRRVTDGAGALRHLRSSGAIGRLPGDRQDDDSVDSDLAFELFSDYLRGAESAHRATKLAKMICCVRKKGPKADLLWKVARAGQSKKNACRNLHRLIDRNNVLFPVPIDCGLIRVSFRRPQYRTEQIYWPFLRMRDWVRCLLRDTPQMLLAGHELSDFVGWQQVFTTFWDSYRMVNPNHVIFQELGDFPIACAIPYFIHGDEGRGYCRRPFMVESWQPVISYKGLDKINESGHSMTTRFLLTCISSYFFDGEHTLDDLHGFIARDATDLYREGITVDGFNLRLVCLGTKGDWVYLRKDCSNDEFLQGFRFAVATSNLFFRVLRQCGVFIHEPQKSLVFNVGQQMCEAYGHMAAKCYHHGWKLFRLRPKLHMQHHLLLLMGPQSGPVAFSALNFSCWSDEDFIGRVARLSRTCHPLRSSYRCIQKALGMYKTQFRNAINNLEED
ncbi:Uncharacterized protein SCF082_LOCUS12240 [Durusdinium trenchii]|uniref:RNA-directed RNA polymerase n=1 Tax=Durusdinium trenchii TaxID=1381693 RepID=A0ABP0JID4_9DINO